MGIHRERVTFTASEVKTNLLSGSKFEFLSVPSVVSLYGSQIAAGDLKLDFTLGNVVVGDNLEPSVKSAGVLNRNEDLIARGAGAAGDRIQIRASEESGGADTELTWLVEIAEM